MTTRERANVRTGNRRLVLLTSLALFLASCTGGAQDVGADADVPTRPQVVEVTMRGQAYALDQDSTQPGRVIFRVANQDETDHDLILVKLPADAGGVTQWLSSGVSGVQPVYTMADRGPGEQGVFAVDLQPGQYGMLCFVEDEDGTPHYRKGMVADLQVRSTDVPGGAVDGSSPREDG